MAEPNKRPTKSDPTIRLLGQVAMTTVLWASTFVATKSDWFAKTTNLPARIALVAIGIGGFLPIVFVYARAIRMEDEFSQRLHLIALSAAFAVMGVLSYSVDLLHQANFIPQLPATGVWALMIVVWFIAMILTPRLYR